MEERAKRFKYEKISLVYIFTASFFPVSIYVYFCARNIKELSAVFVLISSIVLFVLAFIAYFFSYVIIRRNFSAMIFCLLCWLGCYVYTLIWKLPYKIWPKAQKIFGASEFGWLKFNTLIVLMSAILFTVLTCKVRKKESIAKFILMVSLILLTMNGASVLINSFWGPSADEFELKTEFIKEDGLAAPNIYWIHPDGMLGFDVFEKYYGDSQDAMLAELTDRGFEISQSANFESSHSTSVAIPVLTSPHAYDTWISQYTVSHEDAMKMHNKNIIKRMDLLRQKAELQAAFDDRGYTVNTVGMYGYYYPPDGGYIWPTEYDLNGVWKYSKQQNRILSIQRMLSNIAEINIYFEWCCDKAIEIIGNPIKYGKVSAYRAFMSDEKAKAVIHEAYQNIDPGYYQDVLGLYDVLNGGYDSPRLTFIHNTIAHRPFRFNEDGSIHEESEDPVDYYSQHIYSGRVVIGMVDMIIESDPDAVIVIQADHGLHGNTEKDFVRAFGENADAVEIWNSTISAVRVPEQFKNGEENFMMDTPLNIARYLVNNFVGRNYKYLLENAKQSNVR